MAHGLWQNNLMRTFFLILCTVMSFAWSLHAGSPAPLALSPASRLDQPIFEISASYLTKITSPNATHPYRLSSLQFTLKSPGHLRAEIFGGTLAVRATVSLLAEAVSGGPESSYFGLAARPSLEWWPREENYYLFFSPGGGVGWIDSRGVPGGQGQDLTLNILIDGGVGIFLNAHSAVKLGVQFQHFSNGGATDPNPGLNALGPVLGFSVVF